MKDFSNASFSPDLIAAMDEALQGAVATLPDPVSSMRVQTIAESILRSAQEGERDPRALQTLAQARKELVDLLTQRQEAILFQYGILE